MIKSTPELSLPIDTDPVASTLDQLESMKKASHEALRYLDYGYWVKD